MRLKSSALALPLLAVLAMAVVSVKLFVREESGLPADPVPAETVYQISPESGNSEDTASGDASMSPAFTPGVPQANPGGQAAAAATTNANTNANANANTNTQTNQTRQTAPPIQPAFPAATQPAATQPPAATQAPAAQASAAPAQPQTVITASGSFSSDTGTFLNLKVDWQTYTDAAGTSKLQVNLSATSFSFNSEAMFNALELSVNGKIYTANSPSIHLTDATKFVTTPLTTFLMDAPSGGVILKATWHYKGSYSGVELGDIVASTTLYL